MAGNINKNVKLTNFAGMSGAAVGSAGSNKISGKIAATAAINPLSPNPDQHSICLGAVGNAGAIGNIVIPLLRIKDNGKQLPIYSASQQRGVDEPLAAEDLDKIQMELETLLSSVALRARALKSEYESIDKDDKRNDRRNKEKQPLSPAPGLIGNGGIAAVIGGMGSTSGVANLNGKRKREPTEPAVRKKHSSMTILKQTQQQTQQQTKLNKNSPQTIHTDDSLDYMAVGGAATAGASGNMTAATAAQGATSAGVSINNHCPRSDMSLPKMTLPKNDMPNKFWLSVEPYCMPLTNEDLRLIDDLLEQYKGPLVPPMPPLGPHYSTNWINEDLKEVQQQSNATSNRLKPHNNSTTGYQAASSSAVSIMKKAEGLLDECITGPLTQRLVSALIEEQMIAHPSEQAAVGEHSNSSSSENTHSSSAATTPYNSFRSLSMLKNCIGIENRVKKELIGQGILNMADFPHNDEDEVMYEIKRVSSEITSVAHYNSNELKKLRAAAANEIKRIELKRKLDNIDQEILECYKRLLQYRAKRKNFTIEEQQEIYRLTSEQRSLAEQLERMQMQSLQL